MNLGLFEILYANGQQQISPYPFQAFDVSHINLPKYRELAAFDEFSKKNIWKNHDLSGLLSPRFFEKMGIDISQLSAFLKNNPSCDIYLFHPYPRELSIANDFLELAELEHPGITLELTYLWRQVFSENLPVISLPDDVHICCHCNYFIGSQKFWSGYSVFIREFMNLMKSDTRANLHTLTPYSLSQTNDKSLPLAVFTFERSISHYLKSQGRELKIANFSTASDISWTAPKIFADEPELIKMLLREISTKTTSGESERVRRKIAVHSYYRYRKWSRGV